MNKLQKIRQTLKQREDYIKILEKHQAEQQKEIQKQIEEKLDEEIKIKTIQSEIERKKYLDKNKSDTVLLVNTRELNLHYGEYSNGLRELESDLNFLREISTDEEYHEKFTNLLTQDKKTRYFHFCIDRNFDQSTTICAFHYSGKFKLISYETVQNTLSSKKIKEKIERVKKVLHKGFKSQIKNFKDYTYISSVITTNDKHLKVEPFIIEYREYLELQEFHNHLAEDRIIFDSDNKKMFSFEFNQLNSFQRCCLLLDFDAERHIDEQEYFGIIQKMKGADKWKK